MRFPLTSVNFFIIQNHTRFSIILHLISRFTLNSTLLDQKKKLNDELTCYYWIKEKIITLSHVKSLGTNLRFLRLNARHNIFFYFTKASLCHILTCMTLFKTCIAFALIDNTIRNEHENPKIFVLYIQCYLPLSITSLYSSKF